MKYVFLTSLVVLALLSVVAALWQPVQKDDRIELLWVSDDNSTRRDQIDLFNDSQDKYRVRLDPQNSGMEKVIVQSIGGVGPDLFDCYSPFQLAAYVRSGIAMDCTDQLAQRGVYADDVWKVLRPSFEYDGRIYGYADNASARAIWYNKRLFDEAGVPYPKEGWTWQECVETAQKLTKQDERGRTTQFGLLIAEYDWWFFLPQWGGHFYTPEGTRCILDKPEACEAIDFICDLMFKYKVTPTSAQELAMSSAGGWSKGTRNYFGSERGAMAMGGRWWLCSLREKGFEHLDLGVVGLPRAKFDDSYGMGRSTLVNAKGKNIEGALEFVSFLHTKEWSQLINRQADALGPVKKYHYGEYEADFLYNPDYPKEDFNAIWRDALEKASPLPFSPFVNGQAVEHKFNKQRDMVRAGVKDGTQAMKDAAKEINEEIIELLKVDPVLKERYYKLIEKGARPAWDNPEDAP